MNQEEYIYFACPKCGNILSRESLLNKDSDLIEKYPDRKIVVAINGGFPQISKYKKCNNIFWLDKTTETQLQNNIEIQKSDFLNIKDLKRALDENIYNTKSHEIFLRQQINFRFKNRIKDNQIFITSIEEEGIWFDNINKLIKLLRPDDIKKTFLLVELNRYLCRYQ